MSFFREDDDIFSPVRFDQSLSDSKNSEGSFASKTSIEKGYLLKNSMQNMVTAQLSDLESKEQNNIFSPISDILYAADTSNRSNLPVSPVTSSQNISNNSVNPKKLSTDFKGEISRLRTTSKNENIAVKKDRLDKINQNAAKDSRRMATQQPEVKSEKSKRPTTLLPLNKSHEECNSKIDILKNKAVKGTFPAKNNEGASKSYSDQSEKKTSEKENTLIDGNFNEEVEKMIRFYVSFEADKVRQIMYSHQLMCYRAINKIKDDMECEHKKTDRLCKIIEELVYIHETLKYLNPEHQEHV